MKTFHTRNIISAFFAVFTCALLACSAAESPSQAPATDEVQTVKEGLRACPVGQTLCTCHCVSGDVSACFRSGLAGSEDCKEFCLDSC